MINLENYQKEKLTINLVWANLFAVLIMIPIFVLFGLPYMLIWGSQFSSDNLKKSISEHFT